jgi:hypothetical protein
MDYNKNKYNLIKQIGGGIEEYRDQSKPVLERIFTTIEKFSKYQYSGDPLKKSTLIDSMLQKFGRCTVIKVRGNGLCLLNAICAAFFIMKRVKNISSLLSQEIPESVYNKDRGIPYENQLNISITEYIMIIYRRVEAELIPMSKKIVALIIKTMNPTYDNFDDFYDILEFRKDMESNIYFFNQLGQILSTFLSCVIISLDKIGVLHGVFPSGDGLSVSLGDISVQQITDNISTGVWDVIFITDAAGTHYHSLIPLTDSDDIKKSNIKVYNRMVSITWN